MIKTYHNRQEESSKRMQLRSACGTFKNIVHQGTNCSLFEAGVITEKAQEVFELGGYSNQQSFLSGQVKWRAIAENEPPGKKLVDCQYVNIKLTLINIDDDSETMQLYGRKAKRGQQIQRMTSEALEQGALLTVEDLAILMDCDEKTIRNDIKYYQKRHNILIPTRGNKKDIGPGITHREKAIELYIKGDDALSISRQLEHSLKAIERYISTFCRVLYCQQMVRDTLKTALIVGISVALVNKYLELADKYRFTPAFKERLNEIEQMGAEYWKYQDSKKKPGRTTRRRK